MIRFFGFPALVLSLVLLVETLPANAASADPLPESNESVIDNAVAEQNAPADNDEPIVVDLDLPQELQAFLAEQEASRLAEADAADPPSEIDLEAAQAQTRQRAQTESPQTPPVAMREPMPDAEVDAQEPALNTLDELPFQSCFTAAANTFDIEESLLIGIAIVESSMDPDAVSSSDAIGLMQIKWPITANHLGISERQDLFDPCTNIDAGARYLRELLDDLAGFAQQPRKRLALASYRLGPNGFDPNIPLPTTAQEYIEKIEGQQRALSEPLASNQTVSTAGPVLPCLVQNLRKLAAITHDPSQRSAQVGQWIEARGAGCSALALIQIRNNLPAWLGTALTAERVTQVQRLLDEAINTPPKEGGRPLPRRGRG
jgi:soluble lytic murein transglycosylase-like protein